MKILAFLYVLFLPSAALSQISCFQYTGMLSCNTDSGITTIAPLGPNGGVITQYGGEASSLTPYTIMPSTQPRSTRSRREHSLDLEPLAPLPSLLDGPSLPGLEPPGLELPGMDLP